VSAPMISQEMIDRTVAFHRSLCPGLALGMKAAQLALYQLTSGPEDLVALVETDICAVDGVQSITGCTVGNRNLIIEDWGKNAYTFWRRSDGKGIRIHGKPAWDTTYQALRRKVSAGEATTTEVKLLERMTDEEAWRIIEMDPFALFDVTPVSAPAPHTSTVDPWIVCGACHEPVMETRTRRVDGLTVCIPCFSIAQAAA
jgi:formylmethanofuran dehydrogenase subunit E